jgi:carbon storage regulator
MLILTRRISEAIIIGDDVYLTVLGIKGNQVRLGFDAPQSVTIHRQEIQQRIHAEQELLIKELGNWRVTQDRLAH